MAQFDLRDLRRLTGDPDLEAVARAEADHARSSPRIRQLPCGLLFVRSTKGYLYLGFIVFVWAYNSYFVPEIVLLPRYWDGSVGIVLVLCYYAVSALTVVSLFRAATSDPGRLPLTLRPTTSEHLHWTECQRCLIQRPLKSHHCSKCQRCVRKMDHHCFWINNCVAEDNQWVFLLLVLYATILSVFTLVLVTLHFYVLPNCQSCDPTSFMYQNQRYFMYGSFLLGILLTSLAGTQVLQQVINILTNQSTIESLINARKPIHERPVEKPRSAHEAFRDVFGPGHVLSWLNPLRRRAATPEIVYYQQTV